MLFHLVQIIDSTGSSKRLSGVAIDVIRSELIQIPSPLMT